MTLRTLARTAPVLAALALAACSRSSSPSVKKEGPVVAKVGDSVITSGEVAARLGEQSPFLQTRYKDLEHRKEFVQNMVRFELLSQEAYKRGLDKEPAVQEVLKKVLVQELLKREFDEKQAKFTDEELKAYFDQHLEEFVRPERVRAQVIVLDAPADNAAARAAARKLAGELLGQIKANEGKSADRAAYQPTLFADLARKHSSDTATKAAGGDTRYLSRADLGKQFSEAASEAIFNLKEPGALTGVIEDDKAVRIARLTSRQPAVNRSFADDQVKETIRGRMFRERRTKSFDEYVAKLKEEAKVSIDDAVLAAVEIPNAAPSAAGVPPMMAPPAKVEGAPAAPAAPAPAADAPKADAPKAEGEAKAH